MPSLIEHGCLVVVQDFEGQNDEAGLRPRAARFAGSMRIARPALDVRVLDRAQRHEEVAQGIAVVLEVAWQLVIGRDPGHGDEGERLVEDVAPDVLPEVEDEAVGPPQQLEHLCPLLGIIGVRVNFDQEVRPRRHRMWHYGVFLASQNFDRLNMIKTST